ncbi:uncharacterized protein ARMOST_17860 [Armillaria ostoyae]|uniref:Prolyl 4-hydroxylase alpha subunit Fe(2+) 2OG dioxygenase domain-containing protein n=1 Tax=Armillaria ostoyae TaxID=47428 RepID=A0A284S068_ARMOS|nr:uncharacterized protein ARMOST_17860 [Armillaria ostoyae]
MANSKSLPTTSYFIGMAARLESLQDICDASNVAGVGLGNRNIFDETYRQSKTLDTSQSFCNFDPRASEILDEVQADLVEGHDEIQKVLPLELYRLNVKETFKAHKDTTSAENLMGSLVVVFPTVHHDGSLVLRQDEQGWTFCAEQMFSDSTPEASYFAFYSEVKHEPTAAAHIIETAGNPTPADVLKTVLEKLLADRNFLPEGGLLGFGLRHQYLLKGSDANILRVCRDLFLDTNVRILYRPLGCCYICMTDHVILDQKGECLYQDPEETTMLEEHERIVSAPDYYMEDRLAYDENVDPLPEIAWVTPFMTFNRADSGYLV